MAHPHRLSIANSLHLQLSRPRCLRARVGHLADTLGAPHDRRPLPHSILSALRLHR